MNINFYYQKVQQFFGNFTDEVSDEKLFEYLDLIPGALQSSLEFSVCSLSCVYTSFCDIFFWEGMTRL